MTSATPELHTATNNFTPARRHQNSFVAASEKRLLVWMAHHTPGGINSDHLTALGFIAQCLAGACYVLARWNSYALLLGIFFLALNWLGDSLDGTLARIRNRQRPRYGFYVDHISDSIAALFLMGGLALSPFVHPAIAGGMLLGFFLLSIESYLATYTLGTFRLSYWKFGPTEIRVLLALGNLALLKHSVVKVRGAEFLLFDIGGMIAIAGMAAMFSVTVLQHICKLYQEEMV
ncbi:MAG: CDP-alcohol phosphatidyltransferase family protein [Acidobacteriota bacterium]|nr:CDP-alcohol phosphatidyltransferase family protein [Acidobacteriota bacterium]